MLKRFGSIVVIFLLIVALCLLANMEASPPEDVLASPGIVSISNSPSSYPFGTVAASSNYPTGLTHFNVTNDGTCTVNITINGTDMTNGITWTLSDDGNPGTDTIGFKAGLSGEDYTIVVKKNSPYNTLVSGLAQDSSQQWGLRLYTPTSIPNGYEKSGTITLTAVEV